MKHPFSVSSGKKKKNGTVQSVFFQYSNLFQFNQYSNLTSTVSAVIPSLLSNRTFFSEIVSRFFSKNYVPKVYLQTLIGE